MTNRPKPPRIVSRVVTLNPAKDAILLVRNKDTSYWYPPGGGWEVSNGESLQEGALREVQEECGIEVSIQNLLYLQEFHEGGKVCLEVFWLATTIEELSADHVDTDPNGQVEEARWVNQAEIQELKVYPIRLKDLFWEERDSIEALKSQYLLEKI